MSHQQDKDDRSPAQGGIGRRALFKLAGAAGIGLPLAAYLGRAPWKGTPAVKANPNLGPREDYWKGAYFVHETVDVTELDRGVVKARVDGVWQDFRVRYLSDDFLDWNIGARIDMLSGMGVMCLDGPHSGCLATYGANRGDSAFSLNAAFKGFGFFPKESHIDDALDTVLNGWGGPMQMKAAILRGFYEDRSMWDFRLLSSLELYTTPRFETHSFLNQMANPVATINWLAIPGSYEARTIARLIHPTDPDVPEIDKKRLLWVNAMHDFYHGGPYPEPDNLSWIGCIYYVVEVFDNSPYPGLMGVRVTPPL